MTRDLNDFINDKRKHDHDLDRELLELGNYTELALRIQRLRTLRGLSQRDLADILNTSQVNIVRWETPGYTSYTVRSLEKLSKALGVALKIDLEKVPAEVRVDRPYKFTSHIERSPSWKVFADTYMIKHAAIIYNPIGEPK
ncbi:MAG TPA: helix-turn-helix transcriptional regulator [Candidatus Saccharimonadia bacterium]|nr:helix-turn-helix transcriptional regulator [Candidatus Saccharimonadia bacterium]